MRSFADRESASSSLAPTITWVGVALQAIWTVAVLWKGSNAGLSVSALWVLWLGTIALAPLWIWRWIVHLREPAESQTGWWKLGPLLLIGCVLFVAFGGAFFVRFLASRPALDRYARAVAAAAPSIPSCEPDPPVSVGLFEVHETELLPGGVVRLITSADLFDDAGIVYCAEGEPPVIGEDSYTPLGGGWWHWHRSW
jgi:hypothetical protein